MNYNKIHSYYKFVEIMKRLNDTEKFKFLYDYFYKMVSYDYIAWLYAYLSNGVLAINGDWEEYVGELNKNNKHMFFLPADSVKLCDDNSLFDLGRSQLVFKNEIISIRRMYDLNKNEDIKKYKEHVVKLANESFFDKIENNEIKDFLFKVFYDEIVKLSLTPIKEEDDILLYDIPWMIDKSYYNGGYNKAVYYNGLIRKGVCRHYSSFIKKVFDDLEIKSIEVTGKSGFLHSWNMIKINNEIKFIDITREIHLRNKAKNYEFNKGDWFPISIDEMFRLEPDRDIRQLDGKVLDVFITKDNYKENMDILYNAFDIKTGVKKKELAR